MSNFFSKTQKLGKALMLPVAVLPIAGILLRLGQADVFNIPFMSAAGSAIFGNLALLFAIGIAVGLAKDNNGAAGLAGAVGYFTLTEGAKAINDTINMGVLGGIIIGIIAGNLYNKYHDIELPSWLGFFGGKRFVPIVTSLTAIVLALMAGYGWPLVQSGIDQIGQFIISTGVFGVFAFGALNRLLIPIGLHHVINNLVWFVFGSYNGANGDLWRFFAGDPSAGIFMTGFYPVMMFGLPGAALAMYVTAKKDRKKEVAGLLFSVAFTAFLTGITEPIEFMFMFLAPALYLVHALLTGLSMAVVYLLGIHHGFTFSAGAIDYFLNMGLSTKGWLLIPVGLVFGIIYFTLFYFIIKIKDLKTPGREDEDIIVSSKGSIDNLALSYIEALGGKTNILNVDACITRLRLDVKDNKNINENELKKLGSSGVIRPAEGSLQVVVGTKAEIIASNINKIL
ncbi:N-acetylglucosamine-specific PTS transporter subunit IIBC [Helicovermis profundi]|uniref:N-acetylglucosamine-specific PTS transporter subunit IIBC n=1 Tax=Helicovermis profundi TaxID=3065157 RepID=A0AAU9EP16_9FIRM|nr:N-acetylglucosamine-specific PTS transporter subunit IIBC [Clostridia bacterium S502]